MGKETSNHDEDDSGRYVFFLLKKFTLNDPSDRYRDPTNPLGWRSLFTGNRSAVCIRLPVPIFTTGLKSSRQTYAKIGNKGRKFEGMILALAKQTWGNRVPTHFWPVALRPRLYLSPYQDCCAINQVDSFFSDSDIPSVRAVRNSRLLRFFTILGCE